MALTTAATSSSAFAVPVTTATPTALGSLSASSVAGRLSTWDPLPVASPRTTRVPRTRVGMSAGRVDEIPDAALTAYQRSAAILREASPRCQPHWTLLAAIGRVATDHGRRGDRRVTDEGKVRPAYVGKPLRTRGGERVSDTDAGALDQDPRFDRRVGPLLLSPVDWSVVAVDGDGDGMRNPQDLDDATLALAVLLCARGKDLQPRDRKLPALRRIGDAPEFVRAVLRIGAAYRRQVRAGLLAAPAPVLPPMTIPVLPTAPVAPPADKAPAPRPSEDDADRPDAPAGNTGSAGWSGQVEAPDATSPEPQPEPEPEPEPEPTSTDLTATYDGAQIQATATVSAEGVPSGQVTFRLSGPAGTQVVTPGLSGGQAAATFAVSEPGAYTVTASYAGDADHTASEATMVVDVPAPPAPDPADAPSDEPADEQSTGPGAEEATKPDEDGNS